MTLDQLKTGHHAIIDAIKGDGPFVQRLMALGLLEGMEVTVMRRALGGDPIEVAVMGYSLSLRSAEASQVIVRTTDG